MARALRVSGWALIAAGATILLYLVYALLFTNLTTRSAQAELLDEWRLEVGEPDWGDEPAPPAPVESLPGTAIAELEFERPGSDEAPVREGPLFVVEGVTQADLSRGPGHYPGTALPGGAGNFAVAGHRTTHGAPFLHLDQLVAGDRIRVIDRAGRTYLYEVAEQRVVAPTDTSVIGPDPLGNGRPTLTLTTCHPRFSARQRLVVFAQLGNEAS